MNQFSKSILRFTLSALETRINAFLSLSSATKSFSTFTCIFANSNFFIVGGNNLNLSLVILWPPPSSCPPPNAEELFVSRLPSPIRPLFAVRCLPPTRWRDTPHPEALFPFVPFISDHSSTAARGTFFPAVVRELGIRWRWNLDSWFHTITLRSARRFAMATAFLSVSSDLSLVSLCVWGLARWHALAALLSAREMEIAVKLWIFFCLFVWQWVCIGDCLTRWWKFLTAMKAEGWDYCVEVTLSNSL